MLISTSRSVAIALVVLFVCTAHQARGLGVIKDIFQKITNTNNKTEVLVKQSAPICGSGLFSTPNEADLSPEIIFITSRPSRSVAANSHGHGSHHHDDHDDNYANHNQRERHRSDRLQERRRNPTSYQRPDTVNEVAKEFRFHIENVTLQELEHHGFNRDAPVSFLMHGFTSGYPLQAWISAIVEAYTIDRQSDGGSADHIGEQNAHRSSAGRNDHNLFIVNWNYAARGIIYPRAVANIPIVASYVTRFINDKLLDEARVDPQHIQLVGHSLGAHLAGYIGKNTRSKLGRIYGLDPAGPCFGALTGPLYPSSKRLAPGDANEVISIHTNSALLGIDKPLGRYSVFVEGGEVQPGCKGGGPLASLGTLTWDGGDFDTVACSHSRAPNLLTYRHSQSSTEDDCQMVAYACKDWRSFAAGHCGVCSSTSGISNNHNDHHDRYKRSSRDKRDSPDSSVECLLIGLDWQYPGSTDSNKHNNHDYDRDQSHRDTNYGHQSNQNHQNNYDRDQYDANNYSSSTRRPISTFGDGYQSDYGSHSNYRDRENSNYNGGSSLSGGSRRNTNGRNNSGAGNSPGSLARDRNKRNSTSEDSSQSENGPVSTIRAALGGYSGDAVKMFMRTADTQPYCTFHYQIILELDEPFRSRSKPPMSIVLQDSKPEVGQGSGSQSGRQGRRRESQQQQNSLSSDEFGNKFNDRVYTHLMTSSKKLKRIDHATLIFRNGLEEGHRVFKALHVNYMSHADPEVRRRLSSRLCPTRTDTDRGVNQQAGNRFYFEPCDKNQGRQPSYNDKPSGSSPWNVNHSNNGDHHEPDDHGHHTPNSGYNGGQQSNHGSNHNNQHASYHASQGNNHHDDHSWPSHGDHHQHGDQHHQHNNNNYQNH